MSRFNTTEFYNIQTPQVRHSLNYNSPLFDVVHFLLNNVQYQT